MKRKEIKWRREGRGTMAGRQDGIIFRIFHPWDAPERGHTVSCYDTRGTGREISTAGYREFTWEEAVEFCQKIAAGEIDLEDLQAQFDAEDMAKEREAAAEVFTNWIRSVAAQIEAKHELETAMRWASCYYRPAFNRYRHTKKKRTRKKYEKKILAWYREEVLGKW